MYTQQCPEWTEMSWVSTFNVSWFNSNGSQSQKSLCWRRRFFSCRGACASFQELWKLPPVPDPHYHQSCMSFVLGRGSTVIHQEEVQLFHHYFSEPYYFALLTMPKPLTVWITINCRKFWMRWEYQTIWPASWETYMQVRKQQLELDMEQQTGCK